MLAVMACGTTSVAPRTADPTLTVANPTETRASSSEPETVTATPPRKGSWEQPLWTDPESELDTLLVTLRSSEGQLEGSEDTVITASANNMSEAMQQSQKG